jgi:hypothetical protein
MTYYDANRIIEQIYSSFPTKSKNHITLNGNWTIHIKSLVNELNKGNMERNSLMEEIDALEEGLDYYEEKFSEL